MGRLKRDHTGYSALGIWKKYQQPSIEDNPSKRKSKKNTKRWCKGKVGIEHDYEFVKESSFYTFHWVYEKCKNCGRKNYRDRKLEKDVQGDPS